MKKQAPLPHKNINRRLLAYLQPFIKDMVVVVIAMLVVAASTAAFANSLQPLIDEVMINKREDMLYYLPLLVLGLFILKGAGMYISSYKMEYIGQKIISDFQKTLYEHMVHQDARFFQQHTTANLMSRFLFDMYRMKEGFSKVVLSVGRDAMMVVGLIINMFIMDWVLALIALTILPLAAYPVKRMSKHMKRYSVKTQLSVSDLIQVIDEGLTNNRQVKIYTMEKPEIERANTKLNYLLSLLLKTARVRAMASPVTEILGGLSLVGVFLYGGHQVFVGNSTPGAFVSFLTTVLMLYRPIKGMVNINNVWQEVIASAERTFEVLDTPIGIQDKRGAKPLKVKKGEVEFKDVSFLYADGTTALSNLNLKIPAGKTIAIVGASGAGKTTLLNLLPRFFEPNTGTITIDGQDVTKTTIASLRQAMGYVSQEVALFNCSIYENILYGNPKATKAQVIAAAKSAAAHEFIEKLPEGYNTVVGEFGARLSGGQRQRIAIARALLKDAPILLLDEATSNLDNESERQVQTALLRLMKNRTTLVIAHRLSTIVAADRIYVLEKGRVVEEGSHASLIKKNGVYTKLYKAGLN